MLKQNGRKFGIIPGIPRMLLTANTYVLNTLLQISNIADISWDTHHNFSDCRPAASNKSHGVLQKRQPIFHNFHRLILIFKHVQKLATFCGNFGEFVFLCFCIDFRKGLPVPQLLVIKRKVA